MLRTPTNYSENTPKREINGSNLHHKESQRLISLFDSFSGGVILFGVLKIIGLPFRCYYFLPVHPRPFQAFTYPFISSAPPSLFVDILFTASNVCLRECWINNIHCIYYSLLRNLSLYKRLSCLF